MAATHPPMVLYNMKLQEASAISCAVFGNFSAPKAQEIVVTRGTNLELLRPDDTGKVHRVLAWECFGVVRSMRAFRLVGGKTDYLVVGSDSGRIVILQYDADKNRFNKIHEETYGKTGCRRVVPGEFMAVDPKGRAIMIAAAEKQKFVYVINRDTQANLTISSPLEAHKAHTICFHITGVDVGFENPTFAALEVDFEEEPEEKTEGSTGPIKRLTYYELDLGLNHVTRKWSEEVDPTANALLTVPSGADGPGGVLICAENFIYYKDVDVEEIRAPIPRRMGTTDEAKGVLLTAYAMHKQKNLLLFLLQSEYGDLYKVGLTWDEEHGVQDIHIKYYDTIPVAASLCLLKSGFLFCASEFGNHYLFQLLGLAEDDDVETSSKTPIDQYTYFAPRGLPLKNLLLVDEMDSCSPVMDMKVADLTNELTPQIYTLCGRSSRSSLRVLRHGLSVEEMAVSPLPGNPTGVWAVRKAAADVHHSYIVVSFANATIVLSIVDQEVNEVNDSGILDSASTLSLSLLGDDSLLQVHADGIRHIKADQRVQEWKTPGKKHIEKCAVNNRQVVVALTGGELVYFELNAQDQLLDLHRKEMGNDVACLSLAPVPAGRRRALFLAVGGFDKVVRVLSLDSQSLLKQLTLQAVPEQPRSVLLSAISGGGAGSENADKDRLYLHVGLHNGVLIRSVLDEAKGSLGDTRKRFLGTKPVQLFDVAVGGRSAVLALSTRSWLTYSYQSRLLVAPLSYEELEHASSFSSQQCPEGLVAISGNTLRIMALDKLGDLFNQTVYPLRYTPRKMAVHPISQHLVIIEADAYTLPLVDRLTLEATLQDDKGVDDADAGEDMDTDEPKGVANGDGDDGGAAKRRRVNANGQAVAGGDGADAGPPPLEKKEEVDVAAQASFVGYPKLDKNHWASCVRILDPSDGRTVSLLEMDNNEAAFSLCLLDFKEKGEPDALYLAVATVKDLVVAPRQHGGAFIRMYKFTPDHAALQLLHKTPIEDVCLAMAAFNGRLIAGIGNVLRIYDLGKKKLLRKCENKTFPTTIQSIRVQGDRIFVGDLCEAFHFAKYRKANNQIHIYADNTTPRYLTATCFIDYDTMCGGDKFGNFVVTRVPRDVSDDDQGELVATKWGNTLASGAPNKLLDLVQYHVGDTITSIQKASLIQGGNEVLIYCTLLGAIGVFMPFSSREDVEFFSHLEMHLRQESPPLLGRDHLSYRSYYFPVKECIDGELCEMYGALAHEQQASIANELVTTPADVARRLEEMRNKVL